MTKAATLSVVRVTAICLSLTALASCGGSNAPEAVQGTTVLINPQDVGVPVTDTVGAALVAQEYSIQLRAPNGAAQISTQLTIASGGDIYDVDKSTEPFTLTLRSNPGLATTDSNGVYTVAIDFGVPAAFSGEITVLEVFSGTAYGVSNVVVTCTDNPATAAECP